MNVCGSHSKTFLPLRSAFATRETNLRSFVQLDLPLFRQLLDKQKTGVVAGLRVFRAGIAQPHDKVHRLHARRRLSPRKNYFFLASGLASAFLSPASGFRIALGGAFARGLAGRSGTFGTFFLFLLRHLDVARLPAAAATATTSSSARGAATETTVRVFSPKISTPAGGNDVTKMKGLADFQRAHVNQDLLRQILRQAAHLELEQDVFQRAAANLDAGGFAGGFHRNRDGDFFVFGDFVQIQMNHLAGQRMVLDFLHQREALGAGVVFHGQVHQQIFRDGMMQQVGNVIEADFEVLRLGLAAINGRGHAAGGAEFCDFGALHLRTRISFQCD